MSTRIVYNVERSLTTTVNDIEHIESQSLNGIGLVKVFFQPSAKVEMAVAQVTAIVQTQLRQLPPGTNPPLVISYNASSVPVLQLGLSGGVAVRAAAVRSRVQLHPDAAGDGPGRRDPAAVRRQAAADPGGPRPRSAPGEEPGAERRRHGDCPAEPDPAVRHVEDRHTGVRRRHQRQCPDRRRAERSADPVFQWRAHLHPRRGAGPRRRAAADQHGPRSTGSARRCSSSRRTATRRRSTSFPRSRRCCRGCWRRCRKA